MPHRVHVEYCGCRPEGGPNRMELGRPEPAPSSDVCTGCGRAVRVRRWGLSVVEHWGRAVGQVGFLAVAPGGWPLDHPGMEHVRSAREELFTLSTRCEGCLGIGVADDWTGDWRPCPYCQGVGRVPTVPLNVLQDAHSRWFHRWPHHYRFSLLYGVPGSGELGAAPPYVGPSLPYLEDPARRVVFGPVPFAETPGRGEQAWTFLPEPVARAHAALLPVLHHATTWGALRRGLPPAMLRIVEDAHEAAWGEAPPGGDAPFSAESLYPEGAPAPQAAAGDWLPRSGDEAFTGERLIELGLYEAYRESDVSRLVAHLEHHGYQVVRDDLLVAAAHMPDRVTDARQVAPRLGPHPEWPAWVVFHVPHASTRIPPEARPGIMLDDAGLRQELDRLTDHHAAWLLVPDVRHADVMAPGVSRLVVDVERFLDDDLEPMARVGMGAVCTRTSDGRPLRAPPTEDERRALLDAYYHPHHRRLERAVQAALDAHGRALILDLHTFPPEPLPCDLDQAPRRPDVCIGTDPFHTPPDLVAALAARFSAAGFSVEIDRPYAGTVVPLRYLQRDARVASVMVEVNRRLYLEEGGAVPLPTLEAVGGRLRDCVRWGVVDALGWP